jgi:hypothetical protein
MGFGLIRLAFANQGTIMCVGNSVGHSRAFATQLVALALRVVTPPPESFSMCSIIALYRYVGTENSAGKQLGTCLQCKTLSTKC